jgi:adenylosuccinate lyase
MVRWTEARAKPAPPLWSAPTSGASRIATVIPRYSRPAMARIWSDESKLARWLDVELAALEGWAEVGAIPSEDVTEIRARATAPTAERVAEIEQVTDHDTAAFVDAVAEQLGPEGRWLHYGLTSSDVVDTALSLQIQDAGRLILEGVDRAFSAVVDRAEEHRHTVCVGRSHGVHAEPITFGWKLAGWAFELDRTRGRLQRALEANRVGQLSGTVGTYAQLEPEVERIACERLGLEPDPLSTQVIARDRHAELLYALALTATSLERFATEIRHLARTEVREVEEPFGKGMKGSSAMPHKRNPKVAERICGLARVVRGTALVGLENVPLWHERDISQSSAERVAIPDAFVALDYMLDRFSWIVEGLVVHPERMRRNLDAGYGLVFSHPLLLALIHAGLARDEAYRLVQAHAMRAWEEERDFEELVRADPQVSGRVEVDAVFNLDAALRHTDTIFDRLHALVREEEPVHA